MDHPPLSLMVFFNRVLVLIEQPLEDSRVVLNMLLDQVSCVLNELILELHTEHLGRDLVVDPLDFGVHWVTTLSL